MMRPCTAQGSNQSAWPAGAAETVERLSAYRFFDQEVVGDPAHAPTPLPPQPPPQVLVRAGFSDGGALHWRVGDVGGKPFGCPPGTKGCGEPPASLGCHVVALSCRRTSRTRPLPLLSLHHIYPHSPPLTLPAPCPPPAHDRPPPRSPDFGASLPDRRPDLRVKTPRESNTLAHFGSYSSVRIEFTRLCPPGGCTHGRSTRPARLRRTPRRLHARTRRSVAAARASRRSRTLGTTRPRRCFAKASQRRPKRPVAVRSSDCCVDGGRKKEPLETQSATTALCCQL